VYVGPTRASAAIVSALNVRTVGVPVPIATCVPSTRRRSPPGLPGVHVMTKWWRFPSLTAAVDVAVTATPASSRRNACSFPPVVICAPASGVFDVVLDSPTSHTLVDDVVVANHPSIVHPIPLVEDVASATLRSGSVTYCVLPLNVAAVSASLSRSPVAPSVGDATYVPSAACPESSTAVVPDGSPSR
jgi:hypothetical protein